MSLCAKGSALYQQWVSLVPQVATGEENLVAIAAAVNTHSLQSESARLNYEHHIHHCPECHAALFPTYHPQPGDADYA